MRAVDVHICYEYVGIVRWWSDLGPEGQAGWLSAIGGFVALGLTAGTYFIDRRRERQLRARELSERLAEREAAERARAHLRSLSAWRQAVVLRPIVNATTARMRELIKLLSKPQRLLRHDEERLFFIPELDRFSALLTDVSAFEPEVEEMLLLFVGYAEHQNALFREGLRTSVEGVHLRAGAWTVGREHAQTLCRLSELLEKQLRETTWKHGAQKPDGHGASVRTDRNMEGSAASSNATSSLSEC